MDKTLNVSPREAEEIKREIARCFDEMRQSFERMDKSQQEIERSRARTRKLLDEMRQRPW